MSSISITKAQARRFLLGHHGLLPPRLLRGKAGVLEFIRRVNCIQYDPINVVGQNPHLVLQSRIRGYKPDLLNTLLYTEHRLVDGFDKQMSIYPAEDWPQFSYYRSEHVKLYTEGETSAPAAPLMEGILEEIRRRGPLSSLEIEGNHRMDWWLAGSVRSVRIALDMLLYSGQIVVHHRVGTRRYFELSERVLPLSLIRAKSPKMSAEKYLEWHVLRRTAGVGMMDLRVGAACGGMIGWRGGNIRAAILRLVRKGQLIPVQIAELPRRRYHIRSDALPALQAAARKPRSKPAAAFIAPLDNLLWDLSLMEGLFDFHYRWEVYKPAAKRDYGYYVLPVLYGDRFVARCDPGFDRESRTLVIKNWWWEAPVDPRDPTMLSAIRECLEDFAAYLGAKNIRDESHLG